MINQIFAPPFHATPKPPRKKKRERKKEKAKESEKLHTYGTY